MTNRKIFIQNYIMSLKERTRNQQSGIVLGFDWVIYNLALSKNWVPIDLPFFRSIEQKDFITKNKAQFGVDMSFVNNNELIIFVLKDEALKNQNWTKDNFDYDIRRAAAPDINAIEGYDIYKIKIILAYNKDDDDTGIELFNRLVSTFPKTIFNNVELSFERWNLSRIVEEVNKSLITPELLPQHLSGLLSYITSQIQEFRYGSEEWEKILIPNWKNFLNLLLSDKIDERRLRMIPVSLYIIDNYRNKEKPDSYPGWIDLIEWAILAIWDKYDKTDQVELKQIIYVDLWHSFYLAELEKYLITNQELFYTEHGIVSSGGVGYLGPLNDSYLTYWIIGRIGIIHLGFQEIFPAEERIESELVQRLIQRSYDWIRNIFKNNPASYRPLIDLNHIELYLIWLIIYQINDKNFMKEWLRELESRLVVRRFYHHKIPFIEGRNRYDLVAEYAASFSILKKIPDEFVDSSSYLLLMLLELMFSLEGNDRDELLDKYWKHLILGLGDDGKSLSEPTHEVDLQSWVPPDNWSSRIYREKVTDGISVSTNNFHNQDEKSLSEKIKTFIEWSEKQFPQKLFFNNPLSSYLLACIKNQSPLPSHFWRGTIFPELFKDKNEIKV